MQEKNHNQDNEVEKPGLLERRRNEWTGFIREVAVKPLPQPIVEVRTPGFSVCPSDPTYWLRFAIRGVWRWRGGGGALGGGGGAHYVQLIKGQNCLPANEGTLKGLRGTYIFLH